LGYLIMRARLVTEGIENILKGKSEEDVSKSISKMRNVNRVFQDGQTRLHQAAKEGQSKVVKQLIQAGANVNVEDNYSATPIMYSKTPEIIEILKGSGANTQFDKIIEFILRRKIHDNKTTTNIIDYILKKFKGVNLNTILSLATRKSAELTKLLIDKGGNVNYVDKSGKNLLMKVILRDSWNSDYDSKDDRIKIIKTLIDNGINVNYIDKSPDLNAFGEDLKRHPTAMDYAVRYHNDLSDKEKIQIAKILMDAGFEFSIIKNKYDQQNIKTFLRKNKVISYDTSDINQQLIDAVEGRHKQDINLALKNGADVIWELKYGFNEYDEKTINKILAKIESYDESKDTFKIRYLITNETGQIKFEDFVEYDGYIVLEDKENIKKEINEIKKYIKTSTDHLNQLSKSIKKIESIIK